MNKNNISIPTGTIKSFLPTASYSSLSTFQFLLVRLKEYLQLDDKSVEAISIPTGTIKSSNSKGFKYSYENISIPTGTIKR